MSDLGQLLKKARLDKNISLEQLEELTKIRKRYLEAIETGEYKVLPGSFYVRAFIKSYAESVGLDHNEVLALYGNVIPASEVETHVEPIRRQKTHTRNTDKISKWASTILMIAFVMLILGVSYFFINQSYDGDSEKKVNEDERITEKISDGTTSNTSDSPTVVPAPTVTTTPTPTPPPTPILTLVRSEGSTDYYEVVNADKLKVQMNVTGEEFWFRIDKMVPERQLIEQKLFRKAETREWISDMSIYMVVGLPVAAEVTVNGTLLSFADVRNLRNVQIDLKKP